MEAQIQNAIEVAWNPSADQNLKAQAFEFLNQLRTEPQQASQICISLFTREPRLDDVVRHVSLDVVNHAIQSGQLDKTHLIGIRDGLFGYARHVYGSRDVAEDSPTLQNKVAQTLTYIFEALYNTEWTTFFQDLQQIGHPEAQADARVPKGIALYLRVLASVHDEIADQLIQASSDKQKQFNDLKDLIRVRDARTITASWQAILSQWRQNDHVLTELCLKTISRWVSWTDISLIVNEALLNNLFEIASQNGGNGGNNVQSRVRDAAIDVFTEIIAKKMKSTEKIELIRFLNVVRVVEALVSSPSLQGARGTPAYEVDMAEAVAKLVNNALDDIVRVLDSGDAPDQTRQYAEELLQAFVPYLLRFFSDEYDEVCSTVVPALNEVLTFLRKFAKANGSLPSPYGEMLSPILDAIISKTRYDDTSSWGEEDEETDEAEFQELRKRLRVLQQIVAAVNETLYMKTVDVLVESIFARLRTEGSKLNWRDLDLAMYEMYQMGELALRNGGLFQKKNPSTAAAERLIQLMAVMLESGAAIYPHPSIHLQYMETCVRYSVYFEQHPERIPKVLEDFVGFVHSDHVKVRTRSWGLFLRLVKTLKNNLGNVAETVVMAIQDLLVIKAEVSDESTEDDMSSNQDSRSADTLFNSQLNLFEALGCISSASSVSEEKQVFMARSIVQPLAAGIEQNLRSASEGDERALLQIHHCIMALGTLAHGFSDWVPGTSGKPAPEAVSQEFLRASEITLVALTSLKGSMLIRTAARSAFARMIGVLGYKILQGLPQWIEGFLTASSTKDEMASFLRLLDQVVFGFKTQIFDILDTLLTPLLQRIFAGFAEQATGTDDEIQLGELRREYLGFLLVLLGHNLESVFVSTTNQAIFETIITTIEHFAKDTRGQPDAKLALSVLTKMCTVWGGPDIADPANNATAPNPTLPGFDRFMMARFSSLTWSLMTSPGFDVNDSQAPRVLGEVATLQLAILAKTGREYLSWLRGEMGGLGLQDPAIDEYLRALVTAGAAADAKGFKNFLVRFLKSAGGG